MYSFSFLCCGDGFVFETIALLSNFAYLEFLFTLLFSFSSI